LQITINTDEALSALDKSILSLLVNGGVATDTPAPAAADPEPAPKKAGKKAAPAPDPEPEVEEEDEDLLGGDDDSDDEPTVQDALDIASKKVQDGKAADVKKILTSLSVKKVSELDGNTAGLKKFIEKASAL